MINCKWWKWKKGYVEKIEETSVLAKMRVEVMKLTPGSVMILEPDHELQEEEMDELIKEWNRVFSGADNKMVILPKGITIKLLQKKEDEDNQERFNNYCNGEFPKEME